MSDIRLLPAQEPRVETGSVQFGDDWPGTFIRGDNAGYYALILGSVLKGEIPLDDFVARSVLSGLQSDLAGCVIGPAGAIVRGEEKHE